MLLLHTVLAVVCGGLLVSARPEPIRGRGWYAEDREFTDANVPSYEFQHGAPADFDDAWEWAPQGPQHILAHHAEGFPFPDPDREHWPESPHPHPESPRRDPEPPQFPPQYPQEPHYPPPPGPPPPPPYEGPPHFPHRPPHFPKPSDDTKEQTVYQFLEGHPKFSRLFKLVNYTEDVTNYLNDSSQSVSFFALPDFGFPKPPHHHDGDDNEDIEFEDLFQMREGSLGDMLAAAEGYLNSARKPDEGRIKAFIKYVLLYNVLPEHTPLHQLGKNNTFATALKLPDGSLDGKPLRIRVNRNIGLDPRPSVNFISKIIVPDIPVKNGVIHVVNKPILPPPSIFQIGFLLSDAFSTFTSALQRVGLTDELDFRNVEDGSVEGSPAVSIFVPTNKAFARLPPKLKLFLFSPFGEKALKKLLQFHIVPEAVLHSDYFHNASQSEFALPRDTSEAGEFYAQLDQFPGAWSAILGEPSSLQWAGFSDEDAYESSGWREVNFNPDAPVEPFHREAPHDASHFSFSGDAHPQHHDAFPWPPPPPPPPPHGSPHHPPHYTSPPPPEVWLHYPPPPPPPHHSQDGPHHPQDSPHHPPHFPPPPPLPHHPQDGPHHPPHHLPHFPSPPPPPDVWVHYPPPPPLPHGPHHPSHPPQDGPHHPQDSPHHPPHFPPPPPLPHHPQDGPHHPPHVPPPSPPDVWAHYPPPPHGPHHPPHFPSPPSPFEHLPHRPPFSPPPHRPHGWFPPPPGKLPKGGPPHHRPEVVYSVNATVPTLLENHPLEVKVIQVAFRGPLQKPLFYETFVVAHGQPVVVADVPARNGAIHVITKLLNPLKKPGHHDGHDEQGDEPVFGPFVEDEDEWAGWEEWLPVWAEAQQD